MQVMSTVMLDIGDLKNHTLFSQYLSHQRDIAISRRTCQLES